MKRINQIEEDEKLQDKFSWHTRKSLMENFIEGYKFREYSVYNSLSTYDYPLGEFKEIIKLSKFNTENNCDDYLARLNLPLHSWTRSIP